MQALAQAKAVQEISIGANKPLVKVKFKSRTVQGFVDTGADLSCIDETLFRMIPRDCIMCSLPDVANSFQVNTANGNALRFKGLFVIRLWVEELGDCAWPFMVAPGLTHSVFLGRDFLYGFGGVVDYWKGTVSWHKEDALERLSTDAAVWIPPYSYKRISVPIKNASRYTDGLVVATLFMEHSALEKVQDGRIPVTLTNPFSAPLTLPKGMQVANFSTDYKIEQVREPNKREKPLTADKSKFIRQNVNMEGSPEFQERLLKMLESYHDVIASSDYDIGKCDAVTHKVIMKTPEPVHKKQFKIPFAHQQFITEAVQELLRKGVIEPSTSPYNSPIFAVKKPHS